MGCSVSLPVRKNRREMVPLKNLNNNEHAYKTSEKSVRCRERMTPRNWVNIVNSTQGGGASVSNINNLKSPRAVDCRLVGCRQERSK